MKSFDDINEKALNIPARNMVKNSKAFCLFSRIKLLAERITSNPDISIIILNEVVYMVDIYTSLNAKYVGLIWIKNIANPARVIADIVVIFAIL